ncbi:hypothetical protein PHSY_003009 [Pseudozyma hubeiensis SY62]|uniref:PHD-type domain-containing protein n=1 Tax=Pseudozyma hubeiensis (strain SY62) TaxID=1305764 RepID=R9P251_PSEHS|nr:hypothetical protein PHSY_003009 [Pseudozyma hubeiensis SY62]GAC95433.1 hypothetical protein PHSY_003009 [Pseudozyma hubeiensis SY62]
MQGEDITTVKNEIDHGAGGVSASSTRDVDLTPPKKRIKSGVTSRSSSTEPTTHARDDGHSGTDAEVSARSALKSIEGANDTKMEVDDTVPALQATVDSVPEAVVKAESSLQGRSPSTSTSELLLEPELTRTPSAAKKKKTGTGASSSSTSKSKKSSGSTKKDTSSVHAQAFHDPPSSRSRSKVEAILLPLSTVAPEEDEEVDNALYCVCQRRQDDVEGGMIMCDRCDQWYHYRCMKITDDDVELVDQFICPPCHQVTGEQTTYKTACARSGCRRAALTPFSKYCSDRCGLLAVTGRMATLKVEKNKQAVAVLEADQRVTVARKTEAFTHKTDKHDGEWRKAMAEQVGARSSVQRLGFADAFAAMVQAEKGMDLPPANGVANGGSTHGINGASPSTTITPSTSNEASSATSLTDINEQLCLVTNQILVVDLEKSRLNARLDRLDLRSTLLHLVSDRVPTLPPVGSSTTTATTLDVADEEDEEMTEAAKPKKKKKSGSKSKSKSADTSGGPRCGYDQRLHWDDAAFDAWAHATSGSAILSHETPLDGVLNDEVDPTPLPRWICGSAKRKCRRHVDWSNLCELALDAEKASLNADSRVLTQRKLMLAETSKRLEMEAEVAKRLTAEDETRKKRREEERDRDVAMRMANEGTRRGVLT